MSVRLTRLLGLFVVLLLAAPVALADDDKGADDKDKKEKDEKSFDDLVEDADVIEGLFTFYHLPETGKVYMEILPDQLETLYLCDIQREAGDGYYYDSGTMAASFPFEFQKVGKRIRWVHKNVYYRADEDSPIAGAVDRGVTDSMVGSAKVERGPHPERDSWLIDASSLFLQDHLAIGKSLGSGSNKRDYKFDKDESFFAWIKSFPQNSEIETVAHFGGNDLQATNMRIPDSRSMEHRYRFSLSEIPETDYVPRYADDRVGHFLTLFADYSTLTKDSPYTWYVNRWNLEKSNPKAKLSKPKEPITFWIENTVPHEYREAIRDGALMWNQAYEAIGFKDAVVVKQMPDDAKWDPADIRYNVIRWIVMPGGGYAVGPSSANPFTGEIYAADIRISADYVRYMHLTYENSIHPLAAFADLMETDVRPDASRMCNYGQAKSMEVGFGLDLLTARGYVDTDSEEYQRYVHEALADLVAHEVGHTLGLRHNFRASTQHPLADLNDPEKTRATGMTGSVMDYSPVNLAAPGQPQGDFFHTTLGTYDKWAIEYAYTPIKGDPESQREELEAIASRAAEPGLAYATDEDAIGNSPRGIDPVTNAWDLGDDPIAYYEHRLTLTREVLGSMAATFEREGMGYQRMRSVYGRALRSWYGAAGVVPKYLAGIHHRRDHVGDPGGRVPFEAVTVGDQRRALDFLKQHLFAADAFSVDPQMVRKLAPERLYDFDWSIYYAPRIDYPVHQVVLGAQRTALGRIYHPIVLSRLVDLPLYHPADTSLLGIGDIFGEVRGSIWSELDTGQSINSFRRNLQRAHLDRLVSLVADPQGSPFYSPSSGSKPAGRIMPPADAVSFARADLVALQESIGGAMGSGSMDAASSAHLAEVQARIMAVLEASVQRDL